MLEADDFADPSMLVQTSIDFLNLYGISWIKVSGNDYGDYIDFIVNVIKNKSNDLVIF